MRTKLNRHPLGPLYSLIRYVPRVHEFSVFIFVARGRKNSIQTERKNGQACAFSLAFNVSNMADDKWHFAT